MVYLEVIIMCDICNGSGYINLPTRQRYTTRPQDFNSINFPSYKIFPCPECSLKNFFVTEIIPEELELSHIEYIKESLAVALANALYKNNMIKYKIENNTMLREKRITATLNLNSTSNFNIDKLITFISKYKSVYSNKLIEKSVLIDYIQSCK